MATKQGAMTRNDYGKNGRGLRAVLNVMCMKMSNLPLPLELFDKIYHYLHPEVFERLQANRAARLELVEPEFHPALAPSTDGRCFLLGIDGRGQPLPQNLSTPGEVRNAIFAHLLPSKKTVKPRCGTSSKISCRPYASGKRPSTANLMTLCKQLKEEIKITVYDEQVFEIHVHEGFNDGGVEFLLAGRQPLQYMTDGTDTRFEKFRFDDEYGFNQMKKIKIVIFPDRTEGYTKLPIVTYFMILTLARALQQKSVKEIVSITVDFASPKEAWETPIGRLEIMSAANPWWDFKVDEPKASIIHNLSDVELVLRALGGLTRVHNIHINLPDRVRDHRPTTDFVDMLQTHMASGSPFDLDVPDSLYVQFEALRYDVEEHIFRAKFGKKSYEVGKLTEIDMIEEAILEEAEYMSDGELDSFLRNLPIVSRKRRKTSIGHQNDTNGQNDGTPRDHFKSLAGKTADHGETNGTPGESNSTRWRRFAQNASHPSGPSSNARSLAPIPRYPGPATVSQASGDTLDGTQPFRHPNPSRFMHNYTTAASSSVPASPESSAAPPDKSSSDVRAISRESSGSSQLAAALSGSLSLQGADAGADAQAADSMDLSGDFTLNNDEKAP